MSKTRDKILKLTWNRPLKHIYGRRTAKHRNFTRDQKLLPDTAEAVHANAEEVRDVEPLPDTAEAVHADAEEADDGGGSVGIQGPSNASRHSLRSMAPLPTAGAVFAAATAARQAEAVALVGTMHAPPNIPPADPPPDAQLYVPNNVLNTPTRIST
jgi:hypothetical protein